MNRGTLEPAFIDGQRGKLFVLLRRPEGVAHAPCVLIVPPFAEEMNKTRPMLTLVAQGLAARGIASVLPDLYGTGDSAGDFRDGEWSLWLDDLERAAAWAEALGTRVSRLLAVRLGCLLAGEWASASRRSLERTVFWQPVLDGERFMTQFLRLRVAASMMEDRKETVGGLRSRLAAGDSLEVAGYELSPALVAGIDAAKLRPELVTPLGQLYWMEIIRGEEGAMATSSVQCINELNRAGAVVSTHPTPGEPFWSATEIVRIPALVEHTAEALAGLA